MFNIKKWSLFLCVLLVVANLTGCYGYINAYNLLDESNEINNGHVAQNNNPPFNNNTENNISGETPNSGEENPAFEVETPVSGEQTPSVEEGIPVFSNLYDLREYINENYKQGILTTKFKYVGNEELTSDLLLDLATALYINYTSYSDSVYELTLSDFVGNKIIRAYNSGDYSSLNRDEIYAMNKAKEIAETAKANTNSPFELELYIHDYIASVVDYSYKSAYVADPDNPPRHLTVVGALLDGSANCQGYADAFYVIASMAEFEVGKMSVTSEGEGHMVNTIKLDGKWYVLDVTFDDTSDTSHPETCSYMSFNIGKDLCINYQWNEFEEYNEIAAYTDSHFYYYSDDECVDFGYDKVFYNVDDMAQEIISKWDNYGISDFHVALLGYNDFEEFSDAVYEKASETGKGFSFSYTFSDNSRDYFVHFVIE